MRFISFQQVFHYNDYFPLAFLLTPIFTGRERIYLFELIRILKYFIYNCIIQCKNKTAVHITLVLQNTTSEPLLSNSSNPQGTVFVLVAKYEIGNGCILISGILPDLIDGLCIVPLKVSTLSVSRTKTWQSAPVVDIP